MSIYTARFTLPEDLVRDRAQTISCPVYLSGALVAPTSGTVTVQNSGGTAVIDAASVTITGDVATYSIGSSVFTNETLSDGWLVKWVLVISGTTYEFINSGSLVLSKLYPVITDLDITNRIPSLDSTASGTITTQTSFQTEIETAWIEIVNRLLSKGKRPFLIMEPTALRNCHLYLTLSIIFDGLSTGMDDDYKVKSDQYLAKYETLWSEMSFVYDTNRDGVADEPRVKGNTTIWLVGR